jgi:hypothetical protein
MKIKKYWIISLLVLGISCTGAHKGQKYDPGCTKMVLDVELGTINGLTPKASAAKIKAQFDCPLVKQQDEQCGTVVSLESYTVKFFPDQKEFEVYYPFKGKQLQRVLLESRQQIDAQFGEPVREMKSGELDVALYARSYGTLAVAFDRGKARKLWVCYTSPGKVILCD